MTDYERALKVLCDELDNAYTARDYHFMVHGQRENVEAAIAGHQISWLCNLLERITGERPPKRRAT